MTDCLFCKIVKGEIPATRVLENDHVLAFRDIHPQAPTHVLVIPKRHIPNFQALGAEDGDVLGHVAAAVNAVAAQEGLDQGYRVVANVGPHAGQTVDHLHMHVVGGREMGWPPG